MAAGDVHEVRIADSDTWFPALEGERILRAAQRAGVWLPFECGWGSCGTCKVVLLEGAVSALFDDAPSASPRDARRGRILVCQSSATTDLVIKPSWVSGEPRPEFDTDSCAAVLVEEEDLGPDIRRFRFRLDRAIGYREGQHAILDLGAGLRRCYSMANLSGSADVDFIAKRYDGRPGSERLFSLGKGAEISIEVPYGEMWVRGSERPLCLVAGGTGVAPILGMLRGLVATSDPRPTHVFFGANTRDELVCWADLVGLAGELHDGRVTGALVRPGPGWDGARGFVTDALAPALPDLTSATFYLAGPPVMTDAVLALLKESGVQLDRIHYDSFG
ncbi:2Fe-2S iron-sulfur cluster binding domain-containing protein [Nocardioides aquiterrae]|uniref:2Fe-2S iron-sulfur cluster-binding protein n=1 Tax=Nocardioides aquiterrae TaxID=203799 RepID=A0ABP4F9U6_9ACTN